MNVAAYGIPWIPKDILEQFLTTKWKLLDYTANKIEYQEILKEQPIAILSFSPPEELRISNSVKWLISPGAGIDGFPIDKVRESGQRIINCHANAIAVAEHAWSLLMSAAKQITKYDSLIRSSQRWPDRGQIRDVNTDLFDNVIGIVGYGAIGSILDSYAESFGMESLVFRKNPEEDQYHISELQDYADELDFLILACPLTHETRDLVNAQLLVKLSSNAILINVSRGELIVEEDLIEALREGEIRAAGIDVWRNSPYRDDIVGFPPSELVEIPNLIISPHRAWVSKQAYGRVAKQLAQELDMIAKGKLSSNIVDLSRGY